MRVTHKAEMNTSTVDKCDLCGLHYNTLNIRKNSQGKEQYCDSCDRKLRFNNAEIQQEDNATNDLYGI